MVDHFQAWTGAHGEINMPENAEVPKIAGVEALRTTPSKTDTTLNVLNIPVAVKSTDSLGVLAAKLSCVASFDR
jgi:hypothetical protein